MTDQLNDTKHAALLFQNGMLSGHIDDMELLFVHNMIISPLKQQDIAGAWDQFFDEIGVASNLSRQERFMLYMQGLLFTDPDYNARQLSYWESLLP